ncbi:MAG: FIST signal transduction protein, partial [Pseudomonadota bacterium]|nr:FIST signal transduction protein [Pseudomonadota bacterium]
FEQKGMCDEVSEVFRRRRVLGFNTYGEQHCGVHVNQTFVGVAFFDPVPEGLN